MLSKKKKMRPQSEVILRNEAMKRVTKATFVCVIVEKYLN